MDIQWLEVSFETCSEAPMYRNPWKSGHQPADQQRARRDLDLQAITAAGADTQPTSGRTYPRVWGAETWRVDGEGSFLENIRVSDVHIQDLGLQDRGYIAISIGVSADAVHPGGMNLFGEGFGDYPQGIVLRIGYLS